MTREQISTTTLWQATVGAVIVGLTVLVTVILPAEYNIDPTGLGGQMGLTALSPVALTEQNLTDDHAIPAESSGGNESVRILVPPRNGLEYKMDVSKGDEVDYEWLTDGGAVYVDLHGEPEGDTTGYFKSYTITTVKEMEGSFVAPFTGSHGWYFENKTDQPIEIQLFIKGQFQRPRLL